MIRDFLSVIIAILLAEVIAHDWPLPARIALEITLHYVVRELLTVVGRLLARSIDISPK